MLTSCAKTVTKLVILFGLSFQAAVLGAAELPTLEEAAPAKAFGTSRSLYDEVDQVDPYNGNLHIKHLDLTWPGAGGLGIEIYRTYDLREVSASLNGPHNETHAWTAMGVGWRINAAPTISFFNKFNSRNNAGTYVTFYQETPMDRLCKKAAAVNWSDSMNLRMPDGRSNMLYLLGNGAAITKDNWKLTCENWIVQLFSPDGKRYDFGNFRSRNRVGSFRFHDEKPLSGLINWVPPSPTETYISAERVTDANGNWLSYSYSDIGWSKASWRTPTERDGPNLSMPDTTGTQLEGSTSLLSKIEASDGRTVSFNYDKVTGRLQQISDNTGRTIKYSYAARTLTNGGFLAAVTRPDGSQWKYIYQEGKYFLKPPGQSVAPINSTNAADRKLVKLTYPSGGNIEYSYIAINAATRLKNIYKSGSNSAPSFLREERVSRRKLSSGEAWEYSYTRGGAGQLDQTKIVGPDGTKNYKYSGLGYAIRTLVQYPLSSYENTLWKAGSLFEEQQGTNSIVTYSWAPRLVANGVINAFELGTVIDKNVWAAELQSASIIRDGVTYATNYSNHDAYGQPQTIEEKGPGTSRTTTRTYYNDPSKWIIGKVKNETSPAGSMSRTFDAKGNVLSETRDGVTTSFTYDPLGNLTSKTLPGNRIHTYSNYKRGIPQIEVQPEGISITRVVDNAGNITSETNGEGKTTRYTYDGLGRVTSKTPPLGNVETATYTPTSKTTKRGNLVETTQYDPFGRVASITLGGITTRYEHDALGRRTFVSAPGATTGTRYQYDALGRVTRMTNADTSYQTIAYGPATRTVSDERRKATIETYRGYGNPDRLQLMTITAPEPSANITLTRDAADRITSVKQGAFTRTYAYNANGYLISVTNPETGKTVYGRDVAGNMITKQVGASGVTRYAYDGLNRLKSVTHPGTTPTINNTYDKTGKLLTSTSTGGNRAMAYDAAGNLIQQSLTLDGKTFTAKYAYNANDQLASITYPQSGRLVNYTPDVLGRPTTVSGYVSKVTYWPSGMINQITYANGTTTSYTQTPRLWPATFTTAKTGGATYLNSAYTYDGTGNLATIRDTVDSSFNRTLGYDGINRLTSAAGFWGAGSISYDGVGNLVKQTYGTTGLNYVYDAQNRLASVSGQRAGSFSYDAYGNIASSAGTTYTYDGVPNLVCINCAIAANKVSYQYDAINQRSSVTKAGRKVYEMHDADGKQLIELDGTTLTEYIYLGDKRIADRVSP